MGAGVGGGSSVSNSVELGNTSVQHIYGEVLETTYSDGRIKDDIRADVPGLDFITKLRPVTYNINVHRQNDIMYAGKQTGKDWPEKYDLEKTRMTGFIAQEVEQAAQQSGYDFSGVDKPANAEGLYGLRYAEFVMPLVKAVQELNEKNNIQQQELDALIKQNEYLLQLINQLKK